MIKEWESVIGLEVHLQLKTGTKVWCGCKSDYDETGIKYSCLSNLFRTSWSTS